VIREEIPSKSNPRRMIIPRSNCGLRKNKRWFHGQRQRHRVIYRVAGFVVIVGTYFLINAVAREFTSPMSGGAVLQNVKVQEEHDSRFLSYSGCVGTDMDRKIVVLAGVGVLYMFIAIAIVCDEFFVPALEEIASENYLNLSMDVAGATLMAAGGSAPELFTSLIGTFQGSEVGFGTIVGSAVFNVLFVIGMCAVFSKDVLTLTWWPLARDCSYYAIGLGALACFCGVSSPGEIEVWEALILFALYIGYVVFMKFNERVYSAVTRMMNNNKVTDESSREKDSTVTARKPNTFRAGLLNFFMGNGSLLEKVGIGMVTRIAGDVNAVFRTLDVSGDGYIDKEEFKTLIRMLGATVTEDEINHAVNELDDNNDGQVGS